MKSWEINMGPESSHCKDRHIHTTEGRQPCKDGSRDWSNASETKGTPRTTGNDQKLGRRKAGPSSSS